MKIILAPMEGLTDVHMRHILTQMAGQTGFDWCVTEFIRITQQLLLPKAFYHYCPELLTGGKTASGTPVHIQLLGSDPQLLAENAQRVVELGAPAIDLNFGCPAKSVNQHRGGAVLLEEPELVHQIVLAVRNAVPKQIPVSAKMRLGVNDRSKMVDNALAIESAGASWLTIHARTKADGYRPP
ncbi:MAG TPA: tRNA-dihydrouridine synthase family protein, partial [Agitococcus sp.]|nr:tRNA-dihydrouridine synthase family protein [Agitococcus sp.]